eukprot:3433772-Amphidinium_carterae.1
MAAESPVRTDRNLLYRLAIVAGPGYPIGFAGPRSKQSQYQEIPHHESALATSLVQSKLDPFSKIVVKCVSLFYV